MAKKKECGVLGTILLTSMAIVGVVAKSNVEAKAKAEEAKKFADTVSADLRKFADGYHCEIKVDTGDSTRKLVEYLNRKRAERHIVKLVNEACAMDDGLSAEEKAEKVKEAARRMGYDVGD